MISVIYLDNRQHTEMISVRYLNYRVQTTYRGQTPEQQTTYRDISRLICCLLFRCLTDNMSVR